MNDRAKRGTPQKASLTMLRQLQDRGIDVLQMQMDVYNRAITAYDGMRGYGDKGDAGVGYLSVANQAVATLAKYSYPTMTAIKIDDINKVVAEKVIDAAIVRDTILNDPILNKAVAASKPTASEALPLLSGKPIDDK